MKNPVAPANGHRDRTDFSILKGSTRFEPNPEIRNIMITGAAGFM